ncbi:MAG: helix-turn-helix domain-containing protein [Actinobacteria bacterium]|nr:helix-turn-helix domain-containing protein [Actinomycetota bacterium]MCA1700057.1 helix-turn-helix domain-containing protein [Actinomycetota bacterium]
MGSGELLRRARTASRLSQRQLAARAGTGQAAISDLEREQVAPSLARLRALVALTGHDLTVELAPRRALVDERLIAHNLELLPEERLELTIEMSRYTLALGAAAPRALAESYLDDRDD